MASDIEISVGDVSDVEARVVARYVGPPVLDTASDANTRIQLTGTLRGPYCETARTLPAEFEFREMDSNEALGAEAVISDPCLWSAELPHVYHVEVKARQNGRVLATHQATIGLRRTRPPRPYDFSNESTHDG